MSNGQLLPQFFIDGRSGMPAICLLYKFGDHLPGYPAAGTLICKKQRPASYARGVSGRILAIGDRTGAGYNVDAGSAGQTATPACHRVIGKLKRAVRQDGLHDLGEELLGTGNLSVNSQAQHGGRNLLRSDAAVCQQGLNRADHQVPEPVLTPKCEVAAGKNPMSQHLAGVVY